MQAIEEDRIMMLFGPSEPDHRPPLHSKAFNRAMGLVFF